MKRLGVFVVLLSIVGLDTAPAWAQVIGDERIVIAQQEQPRRRTLFDLLFGEEPAAPAPVQRTQPRRQAAPTPPPPPPKPVVVKSVDATRLAVFGDSLAIDLAKALERHYAEDPNLVVLDEGVSASGFVRADFFDWGAKIGSAIAENSFDVAVISIGVNDRQEFPGAASDNIVLSPNWSASYQAQLNQFLSQLRSARKPVLWLGLPPMERSQYSADIAQINALQRMAAFSGGAEFIDIFDRFLSEDGRYTAFGPDLNGQNARMRKDDGIHFANAGADKIAFYVSQSLSVFYRGGTITLAAVDPLAGTDAALMQRPPYQGLGQIRLLEVAGPVLPLGRLAQRANSLMDLSATHTAPAFTLEQLMDAPHGRVDDFGLGYDPAERARSETEAL
ncbi:DUF459 domain-containing protein [Devosia sp. MC521]|uniref:SGNH/GDSL hydrolase family protein n=1 Tax=Devosia sp. MC521 TaxID=2759954 RepID=UPI0015FDC734|nr:DUF459 domain-containing protein [Devosia sp. MC521]MBJ6988530.1 DUF459 domain-containing protein [Devosia sp. MC521]QMW62664.1 DUF459 domain-containing protein [Devosia sp. MC521]